MEPPGLDVGFEAPHEDPDWVYFKNQLVTAGFLAAHHRAWCLNGLRSGKTYSAILAREILRELGYHGRTVILSPENVVNEAWGDSYKLVNPDLNIYVSDNTVVHCMKNGIKNPDNDILILNHGKLPYVVIDLDEAGFDFLIIDEGSKYRTLEKEPVNCLNHLTLEHYQPAASKHPLKRWVWSLTGTPHPNSGCDIYPMCKIISPQHMQLSFNQWRKMVQDHFDVFENPKDPKKRKFLFRNWTNKPESIVTELCANRMQPSIRFRTEDCVDLPPQSYSYFHTPVDGDQKTLYNMIGRHKAADVGGHKYRVKMTPNKINKLLQTASGTVRDTDGVWVTVGAKKRMEALIDLYEQADGKVIVFVTYVQTAKYIAEQLRKKKIKSYIINGEVPKKRREDYRKRFQSERRRSVLILHPEVAMFGTNASAASVTIWWTPPMHGEYWMQGNERGRAPNTHKTMIAMFYSSELERSYYERVRSKQSRNNRIVDYHAEFKKTRKHDIDLADRFLWEWDTEGLTYSDQVI